MGRWRKLGILAGSGELPGVLAEASTSDGIPVFVLRLSPNAWPADGYENVTVNPGEIGKVFAELKAQRCDAIVLAGMFPRPDLKTLRVDLKGAVLLPKVAAAAMRGDGAILSVLVNRLEEEGFQVVGADAVLQDLIATPGPIGAVVPDARALADITKAAAIVAALDPFDVGQGAVVVNGLTTAIEAAEGTDSMLQRCVTLRQGEERAGVLVKRPKPSQERRVDMPTIGLNTIRLAKDASLSGIAIEAGGALVMQRNEVVNFADEHGLFVYGFKPGELAGSNDAG